jgi:hypothetical protein
MESDRPENSELELHFFTMVPEFRNDFNSRYTPERYHAFLARLNNITRSNVEFRVAETPCFFRESLLREMADAGTELTHQLVDSEKYMRLSAAAVPDAYRVPNESAHPHFMTVDFGLVRDANDRLRPKLVELQAFPSIYGYQAVVSQEYATEFDLDPDLRWFLGGHDDESYWSLLKKVVVGNHATENVVLAEIDPLHQKTLPDFHVHEDRLGIRTVDISQMVKQGPKLHYEHEGKLIPIDRIYNRAIVDEMVRNNVKLPFDYRDDLDVEWAGHPNWYFRISKFSIPHLDHPSVPPAVFLDDWFQGRGREKLPEDREQWVFKPLYAFAGKGIQFGPTDAELDAIPVTERHNYLLQQRVKFEPVIATPFGMTQAEVRILYVWPDGESLQPVLTLVRMGRGKMMGVDHNRDQEWVGGSAALFLPGS